MIKFEIQLFGGMFGGGHQTTTVERDLTEDELRLQKALADIMEYAAPAQKALIDSAANHYMGSLADNQIDFESLMNNAQNQIATNTQGLQGLIGANNSAVSNANQDLTGYSRQYGNNARNTIGQLGGLVGNMQDYVNQNAGIYDNLGNRLDAATTGANNTLFSTQFVRYSCNDRTI